ncbi:MAG: NUDIX hydrolase [Xanthomonadaceae bacterium]|nr:NUDIX hydrolase [Xanthomonadaceae bacterium]MDP2185914.1 NUDIX hydrolase [Xanthomonadales bacterium]MDZ4116796.1 NUDIX hydrolase [Xanthomonadaceae bacterium]MDZ4379312.1 NUDIX hydrolase [Xanthomonadaceae bacterium]
MRISGGAGYAVPMNHNQSASFDLGRALHAHSVELPQRVAEVAQFSAFLASSPDVFQRWHLPGHFTGSAWLVSADGERVLLTHHRKLGRWLQLGGHADGDPDLAQVALREAEEESGLSVLQVVPSIFDIDRHRIPARGNEPEHWHYDVRFVVRAGGDEAFVVSDESHALAWRRIDEIAADTDAEASMQRMARRWLERQATGVY